MALPASPASPQRLVDANMPELVYVRGRGLAEIVRLMLVACGYREWKATVLESHEEFLALRDVEKELPFGQVPLLRVHGRSLVQSMAIVRDLARRHELYGRTHDEAATCDIIADSLRDFVLKFTAAPFADDTVAAHELIRSKWAPRYLGYTEALLAGATKVKEPSEVVDTSDSSTLRGPFLVGSRLTFADLMLIEALLYCNELDASILTSYPLCQQRFEEMRNWKPIRDYLASSLRYPPADAPYVAHVRKVLFNRD